MIGFPNTLFQNHIIYWIPEKVESGNQILTFNVNQVNAKIRSYRKGFQIYRANITRIVKV